MFLEIAFALKEQNESTLAKSVLVMAMLNCNNTSKERFGTVIDRLKHSHIADLGFVAALDDVMGTFMQVESRKVSIKGPNISTNR